MKDTIQIDYGSFENTNKNDEKPKNKKLYIAAIVMLMVTITLIMGINMYNNNNNKMIRIKKENEEEGLGLKIGSRGEYLKDNNYELIITKNFNDVVEKKGVYYRIYDDVSDSLSCYTEITYPASTGSYLYCNSSYSLTGCSSSNKYNATRYGVWGGDNGTYCYSKDYMLQARCCKASTGTLSVSYKSVLSSLLNTCISVTCVGNRTAMGSAATLNWYATEKYYGIAYDQRSDLSTYAVKAETGGSGRGYLSVNAFCGNATSGYLYCTPKYGSSYGSSSIATCSSGVMTACDARIVDNVCSTSPISDGKLYGTYFSSNSCHAVGTTNVTAIAICCSII